MKASLLPRGVHFGLPFADYLSDHSLSCSGIKQLWTSPLTWWANSWMNPDRPINNETPAMALGTAIHKRILEGGEAFARAYAVPPSMEDFPDALDGGEALRERCGELGLKKSGTIAEMCDRIREADPGAVLWPEIMETFRAASADRIIIKPDDAAMIKRIGDMVGTHPTARNVFAGGHPEVSVFWNDEETGVPMKARFDYLRPREIVDLKSFSNTTGLPLEQAVTRAIASRLYHVQAAIYLDAAHQARQFCMHGRAFHHGDALPDDRWLADFAKCAEPSRFFFVFVETGAANNVIVRELVRAVSGIETMVYLSGMKIYRAGVETYLRCQEQYGTRPWADHQPVRAMTDENFPLWAQE